MINRRYFLAGTAGLAAGASFALPAFADGTFKELIIRCRSRRKRNRRREAL